MIVRYLGQAKTWEAALVTLEKNYHGSQKTGQRVQSMGVLQLWESPLWHTLVLEDGSPLIHLDLLRKIHSGVRETVFTACTCLRVVSTLMETEKMYYSHRCC
jgi:hypothetical protein